VSELNLANPPITDHLNYQLSRQIPGTQANTLANTHPSIIVPGQPVVMNDLAAPNFGVFVLEGMFLLFFPPFIIYSGMCAMSWFSRRRRNHADK